MSFNVIFITRLFIRNNLENDIDKLINSLVKRFFVNNTALDSLNDLCVVNSAR